jgi:hypothetical protein
MPTDACHYFNQCTHCKAYFAAMVPNARQSNQGLPAAPDIINVFPLSDRNDSGHDIWFNWTAIFHYKNYRQARFLY